MRIGTEHRNKMWRSLVEWRSTHSLPTPPQLGRSHSNASTVSMASHAGAGAGTGPGGVYEVTRYTFKHTISMKKDHDYC